MNQLSAQVVISAVVVWLLQAAKKSKLVPWLTAETGQLNRLVAVVASLCSSVGIHFTFSVAAGTLIVTGLTLAGIGQFAWHWVTAFVSQQLIFQTAVNKPAGTVSPELTTALSEWAKSQQGLLSAKDLNTTATEAALRVGVGGEKS
jgi:hypothetical protein